MSVVVRETDHVIEQQQSWLDPISDATQKVVSGALTGTGASRRVNEFLNGVWLGHPLHPLVTDIPVGAWTVAATLDGYGTFTGKTRFNPGADAAILIGIAGGVASAISGLAQWQYTDAQPRRTGMAHALLNTAALACYGASAVLRATGRRTPGKLTALLGYGIVGVSAYLGGDLVYDKRIGVNHAPGQTPPDEFTPVLAESDLADGQAKAVDVGDLRMMLVRQNGQINALARECSHLGGPLDEGQIANGSVTCPWHGSRFWLGDGSVRNGPATFPQPHFATRVRNGQIEVKMTQQ